MSLMLKYLQYLFGGVILWEALLYVYDVGREQTIVFETWDIQEIRLTMILLSTIAILISELMKEPV